MQTTPFNKSFTITKSDTVNFPVLTEAIYVGGAGIVIVVYEDDSTQSFTCPAGALLPVKAKRVNSTTTSATLMVGLYTV